MAQCNITINLLQQCHQHPKLSAKEVVQGAFHFDATPMVLMGTKCIHVKPQSHTSWVLNAIDTYYIGPALNHYGCYHTITPETGAKCISDMVTFQHHMVQIPIVSPTDRIVHAAWILEEALHNYKLANHETMDAIHMLHTLLNPEAPSLNKPIALVSVSHQCQCHQTYHMTIHPAQLSSVNDTSKKAMAPYLHLPQSHHLGMGQHHHEI